MKDRPAHKGSPDQPSIHKGVFAIIVLIGILVIVQFSLLGNSKGFVKGVKTEKENRQNQQKVEDAKERLQGTVEDQIDAIKKQVMQLDPQDVVSSSPQVQKIIDDLKNLQGVPKNELKNVCESICKGL
ncbi:MAG: hypothetical protein Q8Q49_00900 [bacterium]|nr:hypothetical protein [bacterium]